MRKRPLLALPLVVALLASMTACGGDDERPVNVLNAMEPHEAEALQEIVDELIVADADYEVEIQASGNFEQDREIKAEGGELDVILLPQPGAVADAVDQGAVSLEDLGFDIQELEETFGEYFMSLGEVDGEHYGLPVNISLKSMVWYPKDDFEAAGYEEPETFEELIALSDQIVADGGTPWCVGFESEGATGWPATDWIEDIMLKSNSVEVYDQWVNHEIPFNDESVIAAAETFGRIMFGEGYVLGEAEQTPSIAFGDAPSPMFEDPPACWLHHQANFINAFFPEDTEAGVDYDWFPFPAIEENNVLFAGEFAVAFRDTPEIRDFLEQFMGEEVQCAQGGNERTSRISPNINVGPECYANEILAEASEILTQALAEGTGRFDASDMMPTAVGQGSFWQGMIEYMQEGPDSLQGVLDDIEESWPDE